MQKYLFFALIFAGTAFTKEPSKGVPTIKIGFMGALSGPQSEKIKRALKVFQAVLDEQNLQGGIGGRELKVISYNTQNSPVEALHKFKQVKKDGILILTGAVSSNEAAVLAKQADDYKLPLVIPNTGQSELTRNRRYIYRLGYSSEKEVSHVVKLARARFRAVTAIQFVDVSDSYFNSVNSHIKKNFEGAGGVSLKTFSLRKGDKDFTNVVTELLSFKKMPDVIFSAAGPVESSYLMAALLDHGIHLPVIGNSHWQGGTSLLPQGAIAFFPGFLQEPKHSALGLEATEALSTAAAHAIIAALKKAGSVDPNLIMRAFLLGDPQNMHTRIALYKVVDGHPRVLEAE